MDITSTANTGIQLRILLPFDWGRPGSPTPRHPTVLLWFTPKVDLTTAVDWKLFDKTASEDFQVQNVILCRNAPSGENCFHENDWRPLADEEKQVVVDGLPRLSTAGKLSFSSPLPEMIWDKDTVWPKDAEPLPPLPKKPLPKSPVPDPHDETHQADEPLIEFQPTPQEVSPDMSIQRGWSYSTWHLQLGSRLLTSSAFFSLDGPVENAPEDTPASADRSDIANAFLASTSSAYTEANN